MLSRREFFQYSTALLSLTSMPTLLKARQNIRRYSLAAGFSSSSFSDDGVMTELWLYNQQTPGPLLVAKRGEILEVEFHNNLQEPTTIHWHGIRNLNEMDGVPGLTQQAIEPGDSFTYRFPVNDPGTFWYHAHNKAWEQVARGLYGPLIILDDNEEFENPFDQVIVIDDWLINSAEQIDEKSFGNLGHWSHGGRLGNALTINGKFSPELKIPSNGEVKLRFINTSNARIMDLELNDKIPMKVVSVDGSSCTPFNLTRMKIGPAQRIDVIIDDAKTLSNLLEVSSGEKFVAAKFFPSIQSSKQSKLYNGSKPYYKKPQEIPARLIEVHMQGGAMGNLANALFEGERRELRDLALNESKLWAFNQQIGGYDLNLADINLGETVLLRVWNDTAWFHAMHLHGQHFWVESNEFGDVSRPLLRDTYLMKPGEKADLIFLADNPGVWLFHCHMLEHHASGMGGVISVF